MTEETAAPEPVDELLRTIDEAWNSLNGAIAQFSDEDMTIPTDAAGWSVKDHIAHLAAWEKSVLVILRDRQPQYEGLGVDKATWDADDIDATNEVVRKANAGASLDEVRNRVETVHSRFIETISRLNDEDLRRPVDEWVAGGGDFPVVHKIVGNSSEHYPEHRGWMLAIVNR